MGFFKYVSAVALTFFLLPEFSVHASALKVVEAKNVCMATNRVFEEAQIPITVQGKTYYGCCDMCKERLNEETKIRSAVDPVSKKPVDKATAVIGAQPDGKVFYFENLENLARYK